MCYIDDSNMHRQTLVSMRKTTNGIHQLHLHPNCQEPLLQPHFGGDVKKTLTAKVYLNLEKIDMKGLKCCGYSIILQVIVCVRDHLL